MNTPENQRRQLLRTAAAMGVAGVCASLPLTSFATQDNENFRELRLFNTHTGESLEVVYWHHGEYDRKSLAKLNHLLRDHRQNQSREMDPKLYDQLWQINSRFNNDAVFEIISGYRTQETNNMLRKKSRNVASKSYHVKGQALDIRRRDTSTDQLQQCALSLQAGGVGIYRSSAFVHIDTGPHRSWG